LGGYAAIIVFICFLGYLSHNRLDNIQHEIEQLEKSSLVEIEASDEILLAIERSQLAAQKLINSILLSMTEPTYFKVISEQIVTDIKANLAFVDENVALSIHATQKAIKLANEFEDSETARDEKKELEVWLLPMQKHLVRYNKLVANFLNTVFNDPLSSEKFFEEKLNPFYQNQIRPLLISYKQDAKREIKEEVNAVLSVHIPTARKLIIFSALASFVISCLVGFWISRSISGPIKALNHAALEVGKGRLETTVDLQSKDEFGSLSQAFNQMVSDLRDTTVSREYLNLIIESMMDGLFVLNPDASIALANKSSVELSGYSLNELLEKNLNDILVEDQGGEHIIAGLLKDYVYHNTESALKRKDGVKIPILFSGSVMNDGKGRRTTVCVVRDITDRKRSEIQLRKAHDELEQRVNERTKDLSEMTDNLKIEIDEHRRTLAALRKSESELRIMSFKILTAQEKERRRISAELHDELGQSLSLLKVQLGAVQRKLRADQKMLAQDLVSIRQYLNRVIEDVRRLARDLSPALLADIGLSAALEKIGKDFAKFNPITVSFETAAIDHLFSQDTQIVIYRIIQEIFTNVAKHAQASHVQVQIRFSDNSVLMAIQDNGQGFNPAEVTLQEPADRGLGLSSLQERARMINADFDLWSQKGQGTRLSFTIPIRTEELI
jgi:PAS domain S-box-containing protein